MGNEVTNRARFSVRFFGHFSFSFSFSFMPVARSSVSILITFSGVSWYWIEKKPQFILHYRSPSLNQSILWGLARFVVSPYLFDFFNTSKLNFYLGWRKQRIFATHTGRSIRDRFLNFRRSLCFKSSRTKCLSLALSPHPLPPPSTRTTSSVSVITPKWTMGVETYKGN